MDMIMILIPLSLLLVGVAVWAFFWAVNSGQFDDLETPGWDVLTDAPVASADAAASTSRDTPSSAEA